MRRACLGFMLMCGACEENIGTGAGFPNTDAASSDDSGVTTTFGDDPTDVTELACLLLSTEVYDLNDTLTLLWLYSYDGFRDLSEYTYHFGAIPDPPYWSYNYLYAYTRDEHRRIVALDVDVDEDGVIDSRNTYAYDDADNVVMGTYDFPYDGIVDATWTYTYTDGLLTVEVGAGTVDYRIDYTYDGAGRLISTSQDNQTDGTTNVARTYAYDADGNLVTLATFVEGNEQTVQTFTYDADGNRLTETMALYGTVTLIRTWTYDSESRVETVHAHYPDTPEQDQTVTLSYDDRGNLVREETENAGGSVIVTRVHIWDCTGV